MHASFTVTVPGNSMLYIGYNNRKHLKAQVSKATAVITLNTMLGKLTWIPSPLSRERTYAWETERKDKRVGERESSEQSSVNAVSDLFQTVMVAASACQWRQDRSNAASTIQKILVISITGPRSNLASCLIHSKVLAVGMHLVNKIRYMVSVEFARPWKIIWSVFQSKMY